MINPNPRNKHLSKYKLLKPLTVASTIKEKLEKNNAVISKTIKATALLSLTSNSTNTKYTTLSIH